MPRSPSTPHGRRATALDRYLGELISYGGELWPRGEVMRDLKRCGMDDRCVDRYLQGQEMRQRLEQRDLLQRPLTTRIQ